MSYRWRPKNAELDPDNPRAWGECDRCGMLWPLYKLQWQYAYRGSTTPQNTRVLVCPKHLDPLNLLDATIILPPDPEPVMNGRPPSYAIDEAGPTQLFSAHVLNGPAAIGSDFYLDVYDGDPDAGGTSVLSTLTGSATRSNVASVMTDVIEGVVANADAITITATARGSARVTHLAIFDAATAGSLRISAPMAFPQTVTTYNGAEFAADALRVSLSGPADYFGDDCFASDMFAADWF